MARCDSCGKKMKMIKRSTAAVALLTFPAKWMAVLSMPKRLDFCDRSCLTRWLEKHP